MPSYPKSARAVGVAAAVALATAGCHAAPVDTVTTPSVTAPMVVDGPATARDGNVETHSVFCIPDDTRPFDLQQAERWQEVEAPATAPGGGDWKQHQPCPNGPILATGR